MKVLQRSHCFVLGLVLALTALCVRAQSTAKELFVGIDGGNTQLISSKNDKNASTDVAKPLKAIRPKVLGLRTTIYQLFDDGGVKAVSPSTVFAGGNRIRLAFNSNRAGFLYVVNLGTSGKITTIFPATATDNNQLQPGLLYQVPQQTGKSIRFDNTPGEDTILAVLAESRIAEFEYGGQKIALDSFGAKPDMQAAAKPQRIVMASLDTTSTSKDLFVEDDGVFQTVVFKPTAESTSTKKPLVVRLNLTHR